MAEAKKKDPFWKMKLALMQSVLAEEHPTVEALEQTFLEEFGSPPPKKIEDFFKKEIGKRAVLPQQRPISFHINLIRNIARQKMEARLEREFMESGGKFVRVPLDKDLLLSLDRLQQVYGAHDPEEVMLLALKMLEQQAKRIAPEVFRF